MKQLTEPKKQQSTSAWGQTNHSIHTLYKIEPSDIGQARPHHRGFRHKTYTFQERDVGHVIDVLTDDTGWTCWFFTHIDSTETAHD